MIRSFVDTGVWFGHYNTGDSRQEVASGLLEYANHEHWKLITTSAVVLETHAFLVGRARDGHRLGLDFLQAMEDEIAEVVRYTEEDEAEAIETLRAHADKGYSLCDAISFVVMERLGIDTAMSFDKHFTQYGQFRVLTDVPQVGSRLH